MAGNDEFQSPAKSLSLLKKARKTQSDGWIPQWLKPCAVSLSQWLSFRHKSFTQLSDYMSLYEQWQRNLLMLQTTARKKATNKCLVINDSWWSRSNGCMSVRRMNWDTNRKALVGHLKQKTTCSRTQELTGDHLRWAKLLLSKEQNERSRAQLAEIHSNISWG